MFCRRCGKKIPDDSVFCPFCGEALCRDDAMDGDESERVLGSDITKKNRIGITNIALYATIAVVVLAAIVTCLILVFRSHNSEESSSMVNLEAERDKNNSVEDDLITNLSDKSSENYDVSEEESSETEEYQTGIQTQSDTPREGVYISRKGMSRKQVNQEFVRFSEQEAASREKDRNYDGEQVYTGPPDKSVVSVEIPEEVTAIGEKAFEGCKNLEEVILPDSLRIIGDEAFENCVSLRTINLPETVEIIGNSAFYECGLEEIILPKSVRIIGNSAFSYTHLKSMVIPEGVERLGYWDGGGGVFLGCEDLESVDILTNKLTTINAYSFFECKSLKSIVIPEGVISIEGHAFQNCDSLSSVELPNSLEEIQEQAFEFDVALTEIVLPSNVFRVEHTAFFKCENLDITLPVSITELWDGSFGSCKSVTVPQEVLNNTGINKEQFESECAKGSKVVYID